MAATVMKRTGIGALLFGLDEGLRRFRILPGHDIIAIKLPHDITLRRRRLFDVTYDRRDHEVDLGV